MTTIESAAASFQLGGALLGYEELHSGNINKTYVLSCEDGQGAPGKYILQRLNTYVFKEPDKVMHNIIRVTGHLRDKLAAAGKDPSRGMLHFVRAKDGTYLYYDEEGYAWRAYAYIDGAFAYDRIETPADFEEAGRAFGEFQRLLSDFPASELHETIPGFHDTPRRIGVFRQAVENNLSGRAHLAQAEIDTVLENAPRAGEIVEMLQSGTLPLRVTHNDTKINNVLLDEVTRRAVCVIDLDTVMPGSSLYDYGDAVRYGASTADEDEADLSKVSLDMELFRAFTRGFLSAVKGFLPPEEIRRLPLGIWTITYELGMRFLTDYIDGDLYFKVNGPEHNLIRARCQLHLLKDIASKMGEMNAYIESLLL